MICPRWLYKLKLMTKALYIYCQCFAINSEQKKTTLIAALAATTTAHCRTIHFDLKPLVCVSLFAQPHNER